MSGLQVILASYTPIAFSSEWWLSRFLRQAD